MSLFQHGNFQLHSGDTSWWRIDCDDLSDAEVGILARLIHERVGDYHGVICPESHFGSAAPRLRGLLDGLPHLNGSFGQPVRLLVVDDVLTTGNSMEEAKQLYKMQWPNVHGEITWVGAVVFARGKCPDWITPLFQFTEPESEPESEEVVFLPNWSKIDDYVKEKMLSYPVYSWTQELVAQIISEGLSEGIFLADGNRVSLRPETQTKE